MAIVFPYDPELDPWEWQKEFNKQKDHRIYKYASQDRNLRFLVYYEFLEKFQYFYKRTKKALSIEYDRGRFDWRRGGDHLIFSELERDREKRVTNLERHARSQEDGTYDVRLRTARVTLKSLQQKVDFGQYQSEALDWWNSLTIEQKEVWQWVAYYDGNKAKNCGYQEFYKDYWKYKKGMQEFKYYPCRFLDTEPDPAQITHYVVSRDEYWGVFIIVYIRNPQMTPGTLLRVKLEPSVRKDSTGSNTEAVLIYSWVWQYTGAGYTCAWFAPKQQAYLLTTYAVNDWGMRSLGETFVIHAETDSFWNREPWEYERHWDWFYDNWNWWLEPPPPGTPCHWFPCDPPQQYEYDGSW